MIFSLSGAVPDSMLAADHDPERSYAPDFFVPFQQTLPVYFVHVFIENMFAINMCLC